MFRIIWRERHFRAVILCFKYSLKKKKLEKAQEVTQGELKYESVSVEGITGGFE